MNSGVIGLVLYLLPTDFGGIDGLAVYVFYLLVSVLILNPVLSVFDFGYFYQLFTQWRLSKQKVLLYPQI